MDEYRAINDINWRQSYGSLVCVRHSAIFLSNRSVLSNRGMAHLQKALPQSLASHVHIFELALTSTKGVVCHIRANSLSISSEARPNTCWRGWRTKGATKIASLTIQNQSTDLIGFEPTDYQIWLSTILLLAIDSILRRTGNLLSARLVRPPYRQATRTMNAMWRRWLQRTISRTPSFNPDSSHSRTTHNHNAQCRVQFPILPSNAYYSGFIQYHHVKERLLMLFFHLIPSHHHALFYYCYCFIAGIPLLV